MKVTQIDLVSSWGATTTLSFPFLRSLLTVSPYVVKAVQGLDADEIVPHYYGVSPNNPNNKGYELYQKKRDVVLVLALHPNIEGGASYSDLRDSVYRMISRTKHGKVQVVFKDGTTSRASLTGFISKVETNHFTKSPELQITVTCDDAMLTGMTQVNVSVTTANSSGLLTHTDNISTAPHGVTFSVRMKNNTASYTVVDSSDLNWPLTITPVGGFLTNDELFISTENNKKQIYMVRSGVTTMLGDKVNKEPNWPFMVPGVQMSLVNVHTLLTFNYRHRFWGI